ncbi:MAG: transcriptional repressor [Ruminococcus sp.]|nr:transcriptional repressor [Ruminococcus sp.]
MARSNSYNTKQKERILSLLIENSTKHATAGFIAQRLQEQETPVGIATIYRYLDQLAEEGIIRKYTLDSKTGACYQYIGDPHGCSEHFHLKCIKCEKLFHVECDYLSDLGDHILAHHGFRIDHTKTVLYGCCKDCSKTE